MLFNSIAFLFFFPIVTILYFLLPYRFRWMLLLIASFVFYIAFLPVYCLILLFTIVVDYFAGILIARTTGHKRTLYLILSLITNIGFLCFFKYYDFFINNFNSWFSIHLPLMKELWISGVIIHWNNTVNHFLNGLLGTDLAILRDIVLPIGLSFHTFQAMSYTIEVYRKKQEPEYHFGIYALYVMFYPQLVAGPIERPQNMLHQFYEKHDFDISRVSYGLRMMLFGLFKKVVIADRLAIYVNAVYGTPAHHSGASLALATVFFAIQIYCDFSAYSEIAIGAAIVMGYKLMTNFRRPYMSGTISEFWRRWHISLSSWFTDYLYIPLGGSRVAVPRLFFNLFLVFLISGFWHGANWTFIAWGGINGLYLVLGRLMAKPRKKWNNLLGINESSGWYQAFQIFTTFVLACLAWIFFRAASMSDALLIIRRIFTFKGPLFTDTFSMMAYAFFGIGFLLLYEIKSEFFPGKFTLLNNRHWLVRQVSCAVLLILILSIGVLDGGQFIYFQF